MSELRSADLQLPPENLPPILECSGEFGAEVNSFVPFIHYLYQAGQMADRQILTYRGMKSFYYFLRDDQILEKDDPRKWVSPLLRPQWLPNRDDHFPRRSAREWFPDYRARYATDFGFKKPILAIHNKYSSGYLVPPLNYFPLDKLDELFARFKSRFQIVFLPSGGASLQDRGFSPDHQKDKPLDEASVLARHPEVINFHDLLTQRDLSYNELKLRLYASTHVFFTVQGGNAHLCSLFPGSLVAILHRVGQETRYSYAHGHFQYAANPAPLYLVAGSVPDFMQAAAAIEHVKIEDGRVILGPHALALHARFSEARFR
jgi:hypothetical protein